jgi:hypothetical protein
VPAEYPHAFGAGSRGRLVFLAVGMPHRSVDSPDRMKIVH